MMASVRLFDALADFGQRPRLVEDAPARPAATPRAEAQFDPSESIRREAARAEAAIEERLTREHAAAMLAEQERHQAELAEQQRLLGEQAGRAIASRIVDSHNEIVELITASVARIVGGVLTEDIQRRSIESLAHSVKAALADSDAVRIEVRGPQSLFEGLSSQLGERAGSIDYREGDGFDLTVSIDGRLFETRLTEWSTALSEILS